MMRVVADWIRKGKIPGRFLPAVGFIFLMVFFVSSCGGNGDGGESSVEVSAGHDHGGHAPGDGSAAVKQEEQLWTCSMHPDIKLKEPGKCPICFMDLIPVESGDGDEGLDRSQLRLTESAAALASIETAPVRRGPASAKIRLFGTVILDETRVERITARVSGRLDILFVDYAGAKVDKGEKLVEIYSPGLISAQEELIQALKAASEEEKSGSDILEKARIRTLGAAREKLRLYGLTSEQIGEIEKRGTASDRLVIHSPAAGTVVTKDAVEGMYVNTGTVIYTVADLSSVWISFRAYQSDIAWLRQGQHVEFKSESIPGELFTGEIIFIDPVLDGRTRTAGIRVEADNPEGRLRPDMFVSGTVHAALDGAGKVADPGDGAASDLPLLIDASAPLVTGTRAVVYVRLEGEGDPVFEGREIELGPRAGDQYVVRSGLSEGEQVVVNGAFKIDSELQIRARPSMMGHSMAGHSGGIDRSSETGHGGGRQTTTHVHGGSSSSPAPGSPGLDALSKLTPVYEAYFAVQMALAGDDLEEAKKADSILAEKVGKVDPGSFSGSFADDWKRLSKAISTSATRCGAAKDIAICRKEFDGLSQSMIEMHGIFGHAGVEPYFLTFCPMANDNKGAFWIQNVDTVYNSHYGSMMLRCGEIRERLEPRGD